MLQTFIYPYFSLIYGAAWNARQSLEGLGVRSPDGGAYVDAGHAMVSIISPGVGLWPIFGVLCASAFLLSASIVLAGYVLRRKTGGMVAILCLCLPGLLNTISLWPEIRLIPDTFYINGAGALGSGWGVVPLLGMCLLAGWSGLILISDMLRLGENFGHAYDHVWGLSGIIAAVFFVADSQVGQHTRDLQEASRTVQQASAYLSRQATSYDQWCIAHRLQGSASCRWAANVQQKLLDYSTQAVEQYRDFGPKSAVDIYSVYGRMIDMAEVTAIRTEILAYNAAICPVTELGRGVGRYTQSARCLSVPAQYCFVYPDPLNGTINKYTMADTSALSSECIVPALIALRTEEEKLLEKVKGDLQTRHYRWMYYLFFAFVAGGKIATSTVKLSGMHRRAVNETQRIPYLVRRCWMSTIKLLRLSVIAIQRCFTRSWFR